MEADEGEQDDRQECPRGRPYQVFGAVRSGAENGVRDQHNDKSRHQQHARQRSQEQPCAGRRGPEGLPPPRVRQCLGRIGKEDAQLGLRRG
jgi:hypothetical protein